MIDNSNKTVMSCFRFTIQLLIMTSKEYEIWSAGPSVESLFGTDFPLARDHIDWEQLEKGKLEK